MLPGVYCGVVVCVAGVRGCVWCVVRGVVCCCVVCFFWHLVLGAGWWLLLAAAAGCWLLWCVYSVGGVCLCVVWSVCGLALLYYFKYTLQLYCVASSTSYSTIVVLVAVGYFIATVENVTNRGLFVYSITLVLLWLLLWLVVLAGVAGVLVSTYLYNFVLQDSKVVVLVCCFYCCFSCFFFYCFLFFCCFCRLAVFFCVGFLRACEMILPQFGCLLLC